MPKQIRKKEAAEKLIQRMFRKETDTEGPAPKGKPVMSLTGSDEMFNQIKQILRYGHGMDYKPGSRALRVLELKFGFDGQEYTTKEIARKLEVSASTVRRGEAKGIRMMFHPTRIGQLWSAALNHIEKLRKTGP